MTTNSHKYRLSDIHEMLDAARPDRIPACTTDYRTWVRFLTDHDEVVLQLHPAGKRHAGPWIDVYRTDRETLQIISNGTFTGKNGEAHATDYLLRLFDEVECDAADKAAARV